MTSWHASGLLFESCNCTVVCPGHTHFSQRCTHERCPGFWAVRVEEGACLRRCRSPFGAVLSRWPLGAPGALRLGVEHGLVCLGCCWALMLIGAGAGAAGWVWMAALTALVAIEKLAAPGPRVARAAGALLLALALAAWLG